MLKKVNRAKRSPESKARFWAQWSAEFGTRCFYCLKYITRCPAFPDEYIATLDHVVPLSKYGRNSLDNLVWCCKACNENKGSRIYKIAA